MRCTEGHTEYIITASDYGIAGWLTISLQMRPAVMKPQRKGWATSPGFVSPILMSIGIEGSLISNVMAALGKVGS
jgi:hypothetical protein